MNEPSTDVSMSDMHSVAASNVKRLRTHSPDQTRALGAALGAAIRSASSNGALLIALNGELGTGKTTFVGGLLRALGVEGAVRSPTYTLIEPYESVGVGDQSSRKNVYHLDLYRLADAGELEMLAPRDLMAPGGVLLVEWAERAKAALPTADLTLTLEYPSPNSQRASAAHRFVTIHPGSPIGQELAASLQQPPDEDGLSP